MRGLNDQLSYVYKKGAAPVGTEELSKFVLTVSPSLRKRLLPHSRHTETSDKEGSSKHSSLFIPRLVLLIYNCVADGTNE